MCGDYNLFTICPPPEDNNDQELQDEQPPAQQPLAVEQQESNGQLAPGTTAPRGVVELVLSIVGLVFFLPLCIVSLIITNKSYQQCRALGVQVPGALSAAKIVSWIGVGLLIAVVVVITIVVILAIATGSGASS